MKPKVLGCDEIISALLPELVGKVLKVMGQSAVEGLTLILMTHEINLLVRLAALDFYASGDGA